MKEVSGYGFIEVGGNNLADQLVKNGLARIYGKRITLPDGTDSKTFRQQLGNSETIAQNEKVGGWSF